MMITFNIMENSRDEDWKKHGIEYAKKAHNEAYFAGFHVGRHKQREKWANCGWLQINPEKRNDINKAIQDPCEGCVNRADYLKIGCKADPKTCELKQRQFLAIEIKSFFS